MRSATTEARYAGANYQQKCRVEGCGNTLLVIKQKLCAIHYGRLRENGSPEILQTSRPCEWCERGMALKGFATAIQKYCSKRCMSAARRSKESPEKRQARIGSSYAYKLRQYGMTLEDYRRLEEQQESRCAICRRHKSELIRGLYVDHDHATGKVRGLLCRQCNSALGQLGDSTELLLAAYSYLGGYQEEK